MKIQAQSETMGHAERVLHRLDGASVSAVPEGMADELDRQRLNPLELDLRAVVESVREQWLSLGRAAYHVFMSRSVGP